MPQKRNHRNPQRNRELRFPVLALPPELQLHVLSYLDLRTLQDAMRCSPRLTDLYNLYPEHLLQGATRHMGRQIQNLMLTTYSMVRSIRTNDIGRGPSEGDMSKYLVDTLDTEELRWVVPKGDDALEMLGTLCELESEIDSLVFAYALDDYNRACRDDNPGAIIPPLVLSLCEKHRMSRAFWRLKLYGVLFYNYADYFYLNTTFSVIRAYMTFLNRLCRFEIDEMVTCYQFMVRHRRYFVSAFPHKKCVFAGEEMYRNRDPFECPECQGRYYPDYSDQCRRGGQVFWHQVDRRYLGDTLWAQGQLCRSAPVKVWDDFPETNEPNDGWKNYEVYRMENGMDPQTFIHDFRNLGFCFWDQDRLEKWDFFGRWDRFYDHHAEE
ncbi:hypothetical protein K469DRAFT_320801 [Zopfia rhizophila CBS 207.26]|uniref:F-box domain-containing protein n=1 Tax=Zopfia rhizophila CBS 207.26 TaxID=1314779 RepID=A0A6A6DJ99_9PEZI|nr:hypothetical protein K469DRAFT_320801 [Zopfia rhizophila CBS 207.26]